MLAVASLPSTVTKRLCSTGGLLDRVRKRITCATFSHVGGDSSRRSRLLARAIGDWSRLLQRSEEHTSELQSPDPLVCRLLLVKKTNRRPGWARGARRRPRRARRYRPRRA